MEPTGLSQTAYAKHRGCSAPAIIAGDKRGLVVRYPDRSIDVEASDKLWDENSTPRVYTPRPEPAKVNIVHAIDPLAAELAALGWEPTAEPLATAVLNAQRARHVRVKTDLAEMTLLQKKGELVSVRDVGRVWFGLLRSARQRLRAIPSRVAAAFAANSNEHEIRVDLTEEIDEALSMLSDDIPLG